MTEVYRTEIKCCYVRKLHAFRFLRTLTSGFFSPRICEIHSRYYKCHLESLSPNSAPKIERKTFSSPRRNSSCVSPSTLETSTRVSGPLVRLPTQWILVVGLRRWSRSVENHGGRRGKPRRVSAEKEMRAFAWWERERRENRRTATSARIVKSGGREGGKETASKCVPLGFRSDRVSELGK